MRVRIYGKSNCPYTTAARQDFAKRGYKVEYIDLVQQSGRLPEMLKLTPGQRRVPVIDERGKITVGFGGT